ncbi:MAG: site-2 protease family protein [Anaerolineales bacterium]|nr:site-2 protease family protein [Anaerolineales bacterium]
MSDSLSLALQTPPQPTVAIPVSLDKVRAVVEQDMTVVSVEMPREPQVDGVVVVRGQLLRPSHEVFGKWLSTLNASGYTPMLHPSEDGDPKDVVVRIFKGIAVVQPSRIWINVLLFVLTVISTLYIGAEYAGATALPGPWWQQFSPPVLLMGLPFAATLLTILGAHEFGHYFAARYHKVAVTLPYFLPLPIGFGTLGAFIRMKQPVPDRRKLFDIGVAGPLAGLVVALPLLFFGIATSLVERPPAAAGLMLEGNSLLYLAAKFIVHGQILPNAVTGEDLMINQVAFAAWIGLLVTAINLIPVGQLDGGHTVFALFGENARYVNFAAVGMMAFFAIASLAPVQDLVPALESVGFMGWFLWLFLILFVIGVMHPPALDDVTRLDRRRRWLGYFVIFIFIITFVPVPIRFIFPG